MGLTSEYIEITVANRLINYYENLGYIIPKYWNKSKKKFAVKRRTKIKINSKDLYFHSNMFVDVECDGCQKQYKMQYCHYTRSNKNGLIYCKNCKGKLYSGENSPRWNFELTAEERQNKRNYPEYTEFLKRVLARDKYICQCCGKHNDLEVHHINSYDWCIDSRTDETNGITLCKNCHKTFHCLYGYGKNTKQQYEEWIGYSIGKLVKYNGVLSTTKNIYCYEENKIYSSAKEFAETHNFKNVSRIYDVCNHKNNSYSIKNFHLFWNDEFINMTGHEINTYVNPEIYLTYSTWKKVICLETLNVYSSIVDASKNENISQNSIKRSCKGIRPFVKSKTTGKISSWMYYDDYLKKEN